MFRRRAEHLALLGSPPYGRLAGQLGHDPAPARLIIGDDGPWDLGLRLRKAGSWRCHVVNWLEAA